MPIVNHAEFVVHIGYKKSSHPDNIALIFSFNLVMGLQAADVPALGEVAVKLHFLQLCIMAFMVLHGTANVLKILLFPFIDQRWVEYPRIVLKYDYHYLKIILFKSKSSW